MVSSPEFSEFIEQFRARAARRLMEFEAEMDRTRAASLRAAQQPAQHVPQYQAQQAVLVPGARQASGPVHSVLKRRRL